MTVTDSEGVVKLLGYYRKKRKHKLVYKKRGYFIVPDEFYCANCGHFWMQRVDKPKLCPNCHSGKPEKVTEFVEMRAAILHYRRKSRQNTGKGAEKGGNHESLYQAS